MENKIKEIKPVGKPKKFTKEQEEQIYEEAKMIIKRKTLKDLAKEWKCHENTIRNIINKFNKLNSYDNTI